MSSSRFFPGFSIPMLTLKDARASDTLFSMKSSVMRREGCSLNTEFISAILAALRRASALVGQNWGHTATVGTFPGPLHPPDHQRWELSGGGIRKSCPQNQKRFRTSCCIVN